MITTTEIIEATGLSAKTLTRWHQRSIIPEPLVRNHPSGRGKIGYWPDWVLEFIQRIQELRTEGHSLRSAIVAAEVQRWDRIVEKIRELPDYVEILKGNKVSVGTDRESDLLNVFIALTIRAARPLSAEDGGLPAFANAFGESQVRITFALIQNGFNPVLIFDGVTARVVPDFMVSHELSSCLREVTAIITVPMFPVVREVLGDDADALADPRTRPAQKVVGLDGDTFVEYDIHLGGLLGFELIHTSARTIGTRQPAEGTNHD